MELNMNTTPPADKPAETGAAQAPQQPEILQPREDVLEIIGRDDSNLPSLPGNAALGGVQVDPNNVQVRFPKFKIRAEKSVVKDASIPIGAFMLDGESKVSVPFPPLNDERCVVTFLEYKQYFEDNVPFNYRGPKNTYATLDDVLAAPKTALGADPKLSSNKLPPKYARLMLPPGTPTQMATVRDAAQALLLVHQPQGVSAPMTFPFQSPDGQRFAVAKWFLNGWAVWSVGKEILNRTAAWKSAGGIEGVYWALWTTKAEGRSGPYMKPFASLLGAHGPEFMKWLRAMMPRERAEAIVDNAIKTDSED